MYYNIFTSGALICIFILIIKERYFVSDVILSLKENWLHEIRYRLQNKWI